MSRFVVEIDDSAVSLIFLDLYRGGSIVLFAGAATDDIMTFGLMTIYLQLR
jgi:hypothetical protein